MTMHIITRGSGRILASFEEAEQRLLLEALGALAERGGRSAAVADELAARLREGCATAPIVPELTSAWADGASVQVRAIAASGDPVDMGSDEARDFAVEVLRAVREADPETLHEAVRGCGCDAMRAQLEHACDVHADPSDCPDALVSYRPVSGEYGLRVHDGGSSSVAIAFCPWCGGLLSSGPVGVESEEDEPGASSLHRPGDGG